MTSIALFCFICVIFVQSVHVILNNVLNVNLHLKSDRIAFHKRHYLYKLVYIRCTIFVRSKELPNNPEEMAWYFIVE